MALRVYTKTTSVFEGSDFKWCASYGAAEGTAYWRIVPVDDLAYTASKLVVTAGTPLTGSADSGTLLAESVAWNAERVGYGWTEHTYTIPSETPSGLYCLQLSEDGETWPRELTVFFLVRSTEPDPDTKIILCYPFSTSLAYGGPRLEGVYVDLYDSFTPSRARRVSRNRPLYPFTFDDKEYYTVFLPFKLYQFILAMPGLSGTPTVEVCSSFDLHGDSEILDNYNLFISAGHDEYWSKEMRDTVEAFVADGGNVAILSANTAWWQVRFEDDGDTMVCHKNAAEDPYSGVTNDEVTANPAASPPNRPENSLTGVSYRRGTQSGQPTSTRYLVITEDPDYFTDVPITLDGTITGPWGLETDAVDVDGEFAPTGRDGTPSTFVVLAHAIMNSDASRQRGAATMGYYTNIGTVFTGGSTEWCANLSDPAIGQITKNVINLLKVRDAGDAWELPERTYPDNTWSTIETSSENSFAIVAMVQGQLLKQSETEILVRDAEDMSVDWSSTVVPSFTSVSHMAADLLGGAMWGSVYESGRLRTRTGRIDVSLPWEDAAIIPDNAICRTLAVVAVLFCEASFGSSRYFYAFAQSMGWIKLGRAMPAMNAMCAVDAKLFACDGDSLYCRESSVIDLVFQKIGTAPESVFAMAGYYGRMYALCGEPGESTLKWRAAYADEGYRFVSPSVLFYEAGAGALAVFSVSGSGDIDATGSTTSDTGFTIATRANNGMTFLYRADGSARLSRFAPDGTETVVKVWGESSFGSWTSIVYVYTGDGAPGETTNEFVFFYDSSGTYGIMGRFDTGDGTFTNVWDSSGFATGWDCIRCTNQGTLLFYSSDGSYAWGTVNNSGVFSTIDTLSDMSPGWDQIVAAGNAFLFFYYSADGSVALVDAASTVSTVAAGGAGTLPAGLTLCEAANGTVLAYSAGDGGARTLGFTFGGFRILREFPSDPFVTGWSLLVSGGNIS